MMSKNRGKRGRPKKFAVQLKIRDEAQLERTLSLSGVKGEKPCINNIIGRICERIDEENRKKMVSMARKWSGKSFDWARNMIYDCMGEDYPGWDDSLDDFEYSNSRSRKKLNKKLYKKSKKGGSEDDDYWKYRGSMFNHDEWNDKLDDEDNYEEPYKCIKFYSDISNELSVREFYTLKEFNDFCADEGYIVSTTDYNHLVDWSVVHCCLDPISLEYGEKEVITDNSYGGLYWTVRDDISDSEDVASSVDARNFSN